LTAALLLPAALNLREGDLRVGDHRRVAERAQHLLHGREHANAQQRHLWTRARLRRQHSR
jgi:hypothetical protein